MVAASGGSSGEADSTGGLSAAQVLGWLATRSVLLVGLMYVIGRVLADLYYQQFGLSAGSAGLSNTDVVGNAAGSAAWLLLLTAPWLGLTLVLLARPVRRDKQSSVDVSQMPLPLILVAVVGVCFLMALPVVAVFVLGDVYRLEDFGIPLTAFALGVVSFMSAYGPRKGYIDDGPDSPSDHAASGRRQDSEDSASARTIRPWESSLAEIFEQARSDLTRIVGSVRRPGSNAYTRGDHRRVLALYGAIAAVGVTIGIAGVIQQANDLKDGTYRRAAPWSLAPSATRVEVVDASQTNGVPIGECLIEIGRQDDVWKLWDPQTRRLWRTNDSLHIVDC